MGEVEEEEAGEAEGVAVVQLEVTRSSTGPRAVRAKASLTRG